MTRSRPITAAVSAAGFLALGCAAEPGDEPAVSCEYRRQFPAESLHPVDLLLVVDTSPAMAPFVSARDELVLGAAELIERPCNPIDIHVGVISGDPARAGIMTASPAFLTSFDRPDGTSTRNVASTPHDALDRRVPGETDGADEQHLLAMAAQALDGRNPGFRRAHAALVVVFLAASEDRSPQSVEHYAGALRGSGAPSAELRVAATHTPRLDLLVAGLPPGAGWTSALDEPGGALALFEPLLACLTPALLRSCLERVDPDAHECVVFERAGDGERLLLACGSHAADDRCWRIARADLCADVGQQAALFIDRAEYAAPGTTVHVRCEVCAAD